MDNKSGGRVRSVAHSGVTIARRDIRYTDQSQHAGRDITNNKHLQSAKSIVNKIENHVYHGSDEIGGSAPTPRHPKLSIPFAKDVDIVQTHKLNLALDKSRRAGIIALVGLGGVGKTEIATECCHKLYAQNPKPWVFWVHGSSAARFQDSYREIADVLELPYRDDAGTDIFSLVRRWLSDPDNGRWILVLDNADDETLWDDNTNPTDNACSGLKQHLPVPNIGTIIITSRAKEVPRLFGVREDLIIEINPMSTEEADGLIEKKLDSHLRETTTHDKLSDLANCLDYIPLAISQAIAYINQLWPRITVERYLARMKRERKSMEEKDQALIKLLHAQAKRSPGRPNESLRSIHTTWHISFKHLQDKHIGAAKLLGRLCLVHREDIPEVLIKSCYGLSQSATYEDSDEDQYHEDIEVLRAFDFVHCNREVPPSDHSEPTYSMHRLVQVSTRHWLTMQDQRHDTIEMLIQDLDRLFPHATDRQGYSPALWPNCMKLLAHIEEALNHCSDETLANHAGELCRKTVIFASAVGCINRFEALSYKLWQARLKLRGICHRDTLWTAAGVGRTLLDCGNVPGATEILEAASDAMKSKSYVAIERHEQVLCLVTTRLGRAYTSLEKLGDGARLLEEAKRLAVKSNLHLAEVLENLGLVYSRLNRHELALDHYRQAQQIRKDSDGSNDRRTLSLQTQYGEAMIRAGQSQLAEELLRSTWEMQAAVLGSDHPNTTYTLYQIAIALKRQRSQDRAYDYLDKVVEDSERVLGPDAVRTREARADLDEFRKDR